MQTYQKDIVAWANEQARLLRAGRFDLLDIEHIAEEIEDVGKKQRTYLSWNTTVYEENQTLANVTLCRA